MEGKLWGRGSLSGALAKQEGKIRLHQGVDMGHSSIICLCGLENLRRTRRLREDRFSDAHEKYLPLETKRSDLGLFDDALYILVFALEQALAGVRAYALPVAGLPGRASSTPPAASPAKPP
jgi:hypothetical protein